MDTPEEVPRIEITKSPDFKIIYANVVYGGLDSSEGTILFFIDRPVTKIIDGDIELDYLERQLQAEVHIPFEIYSSLSDYMKSQVENVKRDLEKEAR